MPSRRSTVADRFWLDRAIGAAVAAQSEAMNADDGHTDTYYEPLVKAVATTIWEALEHGYHAQNPSNMHPGDFVTKTFQLDGHENLEVRWRPSSAMPAFPPEADDVEGNGPFGF